MSDITREEAIKILKDTLYDERTPNNYIQAVRMGREALENQKTGHWIPVSERLPEESLNSVIGWDAYRERCVFVQYIGGYFQITGSDESFDIVAWMPVPEPYEAESDPWEKWLYPNRKENK